MRKIDAEVLKAYIETHPIKSKENLLNIIDNIPSIPATCSTCIYYREDGYCKSWLGGVSPYDFCSFGRERTKNDS